MTDTLTIAATDTVTIPAAEHVRLLRAERKLHALEAGGVDNWEWYEESLEAFWAEEED